jgi:hypothetical protein
MNSTPNFLIQKNSRLRRCVIGIAHQWRDVLERLKEKLQQKSESRE